MSFTNRKPSSYFIASTDSVPPSRLQAKLKKVFYLLFAPASSDDPERPINLPALAISVCVLILLAFLIYFIYQAVRPNPYGQAVTISNLSREVKGLSRDESDLILHNLYLVVAQHVQADGNATLPTKVRGLVRTGSVQNYKNPDTDVHSGSFIVDFAKQEQSYKVAFEYAISDYGKSYLNGYNNVITCLSNPADIIYPNFQCKAYSPETYSDPIGLLLPHLPYHAHTDSLEYDVYYRHYSDGKPYLEIAINSCGDQTILNNALASAKAWLASLQLNPDDYTYEVPGTYCPGSFR